MTFQTGDTAKFVLLLEPISADARQIARSPRQREANAKGKRNRAAAETLTLGQVEKDFRAMKGRNNSVAPLRGLGIRRRHDPRVALAALAHPGLLYATASRLGGYLLQQRSTVFPSGALDETDFPTPLHGGRTQTIVG